jgi:hypothetical protein
MAVSFMENQEKTASHWQTLIHNSVSSTCTPHHEGIQTHNFSGDRCQPIFSMVNFFVPSTKYKARNSPKSQFKSQRNCPHLNLFLIYSIIYLVNSKGQSWSWSYGSWMHYNYLCNQCLSPLKLWVWIPSWWGVHVINLGVDNFVEIWIGSWGYSLLCTWWKVQKN